MRSSLYFFILGFLTLISCKHSFEEECIDTDLVMDMARVCFIPEICGETKTCLNVDDRRIDNMNVYAYRNGMLEAEAYGTAGSQLVLNLSTGCTYNIYAVANMGRIAARQDEKTFVDEFKYVIGSISDLSALMPMVCVNRNVHISRSVRNMRLSMERLAAKIVLSVDRTSLLRGLQVKSVRLCQSASVVYPFKWEGNGGSRVQSKKETIVGDYATASDVTKLNSGGEVMFYTLENCQGVLLPENDDPFRKVPQMMNGKDNLCTYLEVKCSFDESGVLGGDVSYRIYLGLDDCTSFDLPGNSCIRVSLNLTEDGLRRISWKVDADVVVLDAYLRGTIVSGMHRMSELYVGEKLLYEVHLSDELLDYLGGDASGCSLSLVNDGKVVDGILSGKLQGVDGVYRTEILCTEEVSGELYLIDLQGRKIACADRNVRIDAPYVVLSEYSFHLDDSPVEQFSRIPECEVNGQDVRLYLYLTDALGYNLNGCSSYGFDSSLFMFYDGGCVGGNVVLNSVSASLAKLEALEGNAVASLDISCHNDGSNHQENCILSEIYSGERTGIIEICEAHTGISEQCGFSVGIPQISLTLVDNGWAGYHSSQLSVKVENPSNLPVNVSAWQLIVTNTMGGAVDSGYGEANLQIDKLDYITGEYYNESAPLYGAYSSFRSERNAYGDNAVKEGNYLIYPLHDISTNDLIKAANYAGMGNEGMINMIDATLSGYGLRREDVVLTDSVSDGTAEFEQMYDGSGVWKYLGTNLYTDESFVSCSGSWNHDYPYVSPLTLDRMMGRYLDAGSVQVYNLYDELSGRVSVMTFSGMGHQYGLTLGFKYSGKMNGYVKTYPSGTWFGSQDNYCAVEFSHQKSGVPLKMSGQFVWADDGELKVAMDKIYSFSYKDSPNAFGSDSYMHKAHPTSVDLSIKMKVEGDNARELYPYYLRWEEDYLLYYHEQEAVNYKCILNSIDRSYSISVVRPG